MNVLRYPRVAVLLPYRERFAQSGAGAVSTVVDGFARYSAFRGDVKILGAPVDHSLQEGAFLPVPALSFWHGFRSRRYLTAATRLIRDSFDFVEVHNRPKYMTFLRKRLPDKALVLYLHNDPRTMEGSKTVRDRRKIASNADAVICVSDYIRRCFLEGVKEAACKTYVQHNAVDASMLTHGPYEERRNDIIFAGRTIFDKGPHLLVEAAERILPDFPAWRVVLVGGRRFGAGKAEAYENELFNRIARLGIQGEVTGYIPRPEVIARLQRAAIAVMPALWDDPMPMAIMEAAACGCAVITTRRGGIPEGLGDAALYLPEPTSGAVEDLLRNLMKDPALLRDWQHKARAWIVQHRNLDAAAARLDGLRQEIYEIFCARAAGQIVT